MKTKLTVFFLLVLSVLCFGIIERGAFADADSASPKTTFYVYFDADSEFGHDNFVTDPKTSKKVRLNQFFYKSLTAEYELPLHNFYWDIGNIYSKNRKYWVIEWFLEIDTMLEGADRKQEFMQLNLFFKTQKQARQWVNHVLAKDSSFSITNLCQVANIQPRGWLMTDSSQTINRRHIKIALKAHCYIKGEKVAVKKTKVKKQNYPFSNPKNQSSKYNRLTFTSKMVAVLAKQNVMPPHFFNYVDSKYIATGHQEFDLIISDLQEGKKWITITGQYAPKSEKLSTFYDGEIQFLFKKPTHKEKAYELYNRWLDGQESFKINNCNIKKDDGGDLIICKYKLVK